MRNICKILLIIFLFALSNCAESPPSNSSLSSPASPKSLKVIDALNRELTFPNTPSRIISLAPSLTEIVSALDEDKLVGVTSFCNYPPKVLSKTIVGDFAKPNLEKIISLKPDLILASPQTYNDKVKEYEQLGLNIMIIHPNSIEEILYSIKLLGKVMDCNAKADSLLSSLQNRLDTIKALVDTIPSEARPSVFFELSDMPLMTISGNSFIGELIRYAGGNNIAENLKEPYLIISAELIIAENPEIIILGHPTSTPEQLRKRLGWEKIIAVEHHSIIDSLNMDLLLRPGPRIGEAIEDLYNVFYK